MCAVAAFATVAQAVPLFYLSAADAGATPGTPFDLTSQPQNTNGSFHIWANSDVRLSGVSLDILNAGSSIKLTGVNVPNPNSRWLTLDGPQVVTDGSITSIGGVAIPGISGEGIGQGSPQGANVLLATVNYMTLGTNGKSDLSLRVGTNVIGDWDGNAPMVKFGNASAPDVPGGVPGGMGLVGSITVGGGVDLTPVITPVNLGEVEQSTTIMAQLTASNSPTWSNLTPTAGSPAIAATLSPTGQFSWNPAGSARGPKGSGTVAYSWTATATNTAGADTDVAITLTLIPEPATMSLFGLAMVGMLGLVRRRS
jgi:hypothetical protein